MDQEAIFDVRCIKPDMNQFCANLGVTEEVKKARLLRWQNFEILPLGPRRILIRSTLENEQQIERRLNSTFQNNREISVVNVSDLFAGIRLADADVLEVLAQVVPLDLHNFPPGSVTATAVFSQWGMLVHENATSWSVYVNRSYLDYVWCRIHACGLKIPPSCS